MLSPKAKRNILRIVPFGVLWLVFSLVYSLLERGLLGNLSYYPSTGNPYFFTRNLITTSLAAAVTGCLMGVLEIFYFSRWFSKRSFSKKILYKSFIYLIIILVFLVIIFIGTADGMATAVSRKAFWTYAWAFFSNYSLVSVCIYISSVILVVQFYTEVSDSIGHAALSNFFLGKYHRPVQEERIFMFLDMRSSTTIAEKLGHVKYFEMLKEYFADLAQPVIDHSGEIYQYAGDEMIISWKLKNGLKNGNCIRCFFDMKEALGRKEKKYEERFGLLPGFKAGLHCGMVTTGEIGVLKKEIIFTGDVLNTAARIQGLCNQFNVDILISGTLEKELDLNTLFKTKSLGENNLKGRDEKMELFTVMQ